MNREGEMMRPTTEERPRASVRLKGWQGYGCQSAPETCECFQHTIMELLAEIDALTKERDAAVDELVEALDKAATIICNAECPLEKDSHFASCTARMALLKRLQ